MGQPRRSFTPECKQEAVDLCRRSGKSASQVAQELGIPQPMFNRWMPQAATAPLGAKCFLATEELKGLRRELAQVRMERNILKKIRRLHCQGVAVRYRFIQAEKAVYPVGVLCRVLDVARSGFYA